MSEESGLAPAEGSAEVEPQDKSNEKLLKLPLAKIRTIMKLDPDLNGASQEAVFLVAKATELFIDALAKETCNFTQQNKKKMLQKKDVESAVDSVEAFSFLEGCLE
ncbi:DNA polymerase epsilon subunit 4-like [Tropilaelaps mercedesae]|uniref:DNA polymerase epsilon subunit 4-like n=1 Tax=Tropilaelaps mercedesae TaxID=418985 RepID=A0A1V9XQK9_9ACAR|nr:DNA polymerase epsilon subunit 4-like [Tropilaelaps mercedesae]